MAVSSCWSGMSVAQVKNLQRRLENLAIEATSQLDRTCGNQLWRSLGFDAFDELEDAECRARANYYFGQWQTVRELQQTIG